MKTITREWVEKAEADFAAALLLRKSRKKYSRDLVCFHLQQCMEKYLKARLVEAGSLFPKTHDLELLLNLVIAEEHLWETLRPAMACLTSYAVEVRYPGTCVSVAQAKELVKATIQARNLMRKSIGL